MSVQQRRAATEQHQKAIESINELFDRLDDLTAARNRFTGIDPLGDDDDPVRDAESLLEHAERLNHALDELRAAALVAAEHRRRTDLADDLGTKTTALFPRSPRRPADPVRLTPTNNPTPVDPSTELRQEAS
jgi:hypothetical protein